MQNPPMLRVDFFRLEYVEILFSDYLYHGTNNQHKTFQS